MKTHFIPLLGACLLAALAITPLSAQNPPKPQAPPDAKKDAAIFTAQEFVWESVSSSTKAIKLSEIAMQRSRNDEVRDFAQTMIKDHAKLNAELKQIAQRLNLDVPADPFSRTSISGYTPGTQSAAISLADAIPDTATRRTAEEKDYPSFASVSNRFHYARSKEVTLEAVKKLQTAESGEFDRLYAAAMTEDLMESIQRFEAAAENIEHPELKQFIVTSLPTLRRHFDRARLLDSAHIKETRLE